jgi:hypothetical protein
LAYNDKKSDFWLRLLGGDMRWILLLGMPFGPESSGDFLRADGEV